MPGATHLPMIMICGVLGALLAIGGVVVGCAVDAHPKIDLKRTSQLPGFPSNFPTNLPTSFPSNGFPSSLPSGFPTNLPSGFPSLPSGLPTGPGR